MPTQPSPATSSGIVKNLPPEKGFGFITEDVTNKQVFFHRSDFSGHWDDLVEDHANNMKIPVQFENVSSTKGPRAANVRRVDWPNESH